MKPRPSLPTFSMILGLWMVLGNCYFNPAVQLVVNPEITEENNPAALLGVASILAAPKTVQITGQIVDANGVAAVGATLSVISRTNQLDGLTNTMLLNEGGRFYLILSTGETTIRVDQSGSELFRFTISIPFPGSAMIINKSLSGPDVLNVEFYEKGFTPAYLDMIYSTPYDKAIFTNWPTLVIVTFSEDLEIPSDMQTFLDSNVITNPSISFDGSFSSVSNNILQIYNSSNFSVGTNTFIFGPGIKSATGKSLSPKTITYICNSPCNGS